MQILPYNRDFLKELDKQKHKTVYARITALTIDEAPIETVEGRVTGGSINIDGASAVRRTCSLSMVAQDFNYNDYYWGLNTKFKLEIGVENTIDRNQDDIIWFPQGIFVITAFNTSQSTSNFTISVNGKDKMCLLNGEVNGNLEAQVDFGTIEEEDKNGIWVKRKIPIPEIIRNAVHVYGGEPLHNIIITDLPDYGLELLEYRYDLPMYLYRARSGNVWDDTYANALIDGSKLCRTERETGTITALKDLQSKNLELLIDDLTGVRTPTNIYFDDTATPYRVAKVEYGQTAGYRRTDLVYAGDLIANIGESLTSVLDKIKNMLGEFEYFYDIDGRFIFQQKRISVSTPWSPNGVNDRDTDRVIQTLVESAATAYTFSGGELITQFNNNPNLLNAKNDYVIRGERTGISGSTLPVLLRYAIDIKPTEYNRIFVADEEVEQYNTKYNTTLTGQNSQLFTDIAYDWREIIFQMARDYYRYNWLEDFEIRVAEANRELYPTGRTGYEQYYLDLGSFWRELYYPEALIEEDKEAINKKLEPVQDILGPVDGTSGLRYEVQTTFPQAVIDAHNALKLASSSDVAECYSTWIKAKAALEIAKEELTYWTSIEENYQAQLKAIDDKKVNYVDNDGWHYNVFEHPELLNFWFDFFAIEGELDNLNVRTIGQRTKTVNDSNIKAIYFRDTPDLFFINNINDKNIYEQDRPSEATYRYIQVPQETMEEMFSISAQGKDAKTKLDELINQHGYCVETATITAIPIYYLEPNTRIHLYDEKTSLDGDYIISKITLPLTYNGTMSINATKAVADVF